MPCQLRGVRKNIPQAIESEHLSESSSIPKSFGTLNSHKPVSQFK